MGKFIKKKNKKLINNYGNIFPRNKVVASQPNNDADHVVDVQDKISLFNLFLLDKTNKQQLTSKTFRVRCDHKQRN